MRRRNGGVDLIDHDRYVRHLLYVAGQAGLAAVLALLVGVLPSAGAPAAPPRPGDPPDKQTAGITVPPEDPGITAGATEYPGITGPLFGYLAAPKGGDVYSGILVIHDRQGLSEHFKDIARRLAKAGYVALAVDLTSRRGGTAALGDAAKIDAALGSLAPQQILEDLNASVRYLESRPVVAKTRIGAIGFGVGGSVLWLVLTSNPDVKTAVAISGVVPSPRVVSNLTIGVLAIFGENDRRDDEGLAEFDTAMKNAGLPFVVKLEPKAGRDFFNDTTPRYVPQAAKDAWGRTLDWLSQHLTG